MPSKKSPANRALGNAMRAARGEHGYAQESFALHTGLDRSNYGAIERGEFNVTLDTIVKVASGLNITVAELLHRCSIERSSDRRTAEQTIRTAVPVPTRYLNLSRAEAPSE